LECIAGEKDNYETIQVEDKVRFKVDVSKVYWCSKLSTERTRMINTFLKDGQVLCDMFCGIGPLAVKSAVKRPGLRVVCNDLNPEGIKYCRENIKLNKVGDRVIPFNMDAREFVKLHVAMSNLIDQPDQLKIPKEFLRFDHCYMNLPVDAVEFLDAFIGLFKNANPEVWREDPKDAESIRLPMIHVYGFTYEKETEAALDFFT
jgi:tRNA (guanine37-N1)-methyltransferase